MSKQNRHNRTKTCDHSKINACKLKACNANIKEVKAKNLTITGSFTPPCQVEIPYFPDNSFPAPGPVAGQPVAVVTGTSRGNGRAIAEQLKSQGYYVIGTTRATPGGPYTFPRYKPAISPNIDVELQLDTNVASGGAPSITNFMSDLDTALVNAGNKPLSVVVISAARITIGSVSDSYKKANSLTPFNNDPFPPDPNALNNLDKGGRESGENQARLLREILYRPPSGGLTSRLSTNARIVMIISAVVYIPATGIFSNYNSGKNFLQKYLHETRNEFLNGPFGPGAFGNVRFIACHPSLINTGGLDVFPNDPDIGPLLGAGETIPFDALAATEKNAFIATPQDVGYAISQVVQLSEPPTEFIALTPETNTISRNGWNATIKKIWCGDKSSLNLYESFLGKEFRHPNTLLGYSDIGLTNLIKVPTVSLLSPVNYEDLGYMGGGKTKTLIFSGFNLDGSNMQFYYSINGGAFVPIAVTYSPANIPFSFVDKWITNSPVNFAAYAGQQITLTVKGTTPSAVWTNNVDALNIFTIKISIPL